MIKMIRPMPSRIHATLFTQKAKLKRWWLQYGVCVGVGLTVTLSLCLLNKKGRCVRLGVVCDSVSVTLFVLNEEVVGLSVTCMLSEGV